MLNDKTDKTECVLCDLNFEDTAEKLGKDIEDTNVAEWSVAISTEDDFAVRLACMRHSRKKLSEEYFYGASQHPEASELDGFEDLDGVVHKSAIYQKALSDQEVYDLRKHYSKG